MVDYYTLWVHQIKTPIASMHLQLQGQDSRLCRALQGDLFRIEQYVEMVLTYLRLDTRETDYVFRPCDIDALTRQCIKKFSAEFIRRGLALEYEPCPLTVVTDEKWLAFVIEQILSNALKYTKTGTITVAILPQEKLIIRDTGIGIAPQDLPRIFENGFTGFNGRTDKKASGIGLYLSKRILDNLGCKIEVISALGKGTEVGIDLSNSYKTVRDSGGFVSRFHGNANSPCVILLPSTQGGTANAFTSSKRRKNISFPLRRFQDAGAAQCQLLHGAGRICRNHGRIRLRENDPAQSHCGA